jgi:hypothetical protein
MDLVERYLQAVSFFLPRKEQEDIVRELSENLISEIEDRREELGRRLTESEIADILRRHGHPMLVAGRYRSQRRLIGPVFFPLYLVALQLGLGVALLVNVITAAVAIAVHGDGSEQAVQAILRFPGQALMVFAWTTLAFAALDIAQSKLKLSGSWDPRTLPKVVRREYHMSRARTFCELLLVLCALGWILLMPRMPFLLLGPAASLVQFATVWRVVYVPIVLVTIATAALNLVNFVRPYWTRTRSLARLGIHAVTLVLFTLIVRADAWVVRAAQAGVGPEGDNVDRLVDLVNAGFRAGLTVAIALTILEIVRELYRLKKAVSEHDQRRVVLS